MVWYVKRKIVNVELELIIFSVLKFGKLYKYFEGFFDEKIMMLILMLLVSTLIQAKNNSENYSIFSDLTPEISNYWSVLSLERLNAKVAVIALRNISDISETKFKEMDGNKNIIEYQKMIDLNQCVILLANQMMHQLVEKLPYADVVKRTDESVINDINKRL